MLHRAFVHVGAAPRGRDIAYALCVLVILTVGVVGVLLLNTAMAQQSDQMTVQRQRIASLDQHAQVLRADLDWQNDPARLASRARALHLRPVTRVVFLSARRPGAATSRAG